MWQDSTLRTAPKTSSPARLRAELPAQGLGLRVVGYELKAVVETKNIRAEAAAPQLRISELCVIEPVLVPR